MRPTQFPGHHPHRNSGLTSIPDQIPEHLAKAKDKDSKLATALRLRSVGIVDQPKSSAGRRTVSIPVQLANILSAHLTQCGLTGAEPDALLFSTADGEPLDYSNWRQRVWLPALQDADLKGVGFHDLRRTNATALVLDGVDVKTAQTRLGHSDPRLTLALYAQATGEGDRSAAQKLGARLMASTSLDHDSNAVGTTES